MNLDPRIKSNVRFADDSTVTAEGVGRVLITCKNGEVAYMDDVLYVPTMKSNLLNLGQLLEKSYTMSMHQNLIEVFDKKQRLMIKAPLAKNRTFKVNLNAATIQCLSSLNVEEENESTTFNWLEAETYLNPSVVASNCLEEKRPEETEQIVANEEVYNRRSQRARFPSTRLADHEVFTDKEIADSG
ncbi:hypothetical protein V8G54_012090 [Vigna mungo]|uniref:Retrovirus-related Pol polyprotein from transposon TNT 1-94-like beta-barrel domain-containing protein n=1 Tax=Vigna mungo TaxID=3915 RepID=A0AAQ3S3P4_VIGMU